MTQPIRRSVVSQLPAVRFGGERAAQFLREAQTAIAASPNTPERRAARRERVLAFPWAAARLAAITGAPAHRWNGYITENRDPHTGREVPPRTYPLAEQTWRTNESPYHVAMRTLLADVARAEAEQDGGTDVVQGG